MDTTSSAAGKYILAPEECYDPADLRIAVAGVLLVAAGAASLLQAQQAAPDVILTNGKIITVDDRFSIAQAVAIQGDTPCGRHQSGYRRLAGPPPGGSTLRDVHHPRADRQPHAPAGRRHDLEGSPAGRHRFRKRALEMLRARAAAAREWVYTLGGWAMEQFADDKRPFTCDELDLAVPQSGLPAGLLP